MTLSSLILAASLCGQTETWDIQITISAQRTWSAGGYGLDTGLPPPNWGRVASPERQRELAREIRRKYPANDVDLMARRIMDLEHTLRIREELHRRRRLYLASLPPADAFLPWYPVLFLDAPAPRNIFDIRENVNDLIRSGLMVPMH